MHKFSEPSYSKRPSLASADWSDLHAHTAAVSRVICHLNKNPAGKHTLMEFAEVAGCSIWHLDRIFRRVTYMSPMAFLSATRIEAAKRLLITTDAQIIDICYEVGFNSVGSFGKRFTNLVGACPRQVRTEAMQFDTAEFRRCIRVEGGTRSAPRACDVEVEVVSGEPDGDSYFVFVGLFREEVPTAVPVSCTLHEGLGPVRLRRPTPGQYRAFAVAVPTDADAEQALLQDWTLRGCVTGLALGTAEVSDRIKLVLGRPRLVSPPLLPILPLVFRRQYARGAAEDSGTYV